MKEFNEKYPKSHVRSPSTGRTLERNVSFITQRTRNENKSEQKDVQNQKPIPQKAIPSIPQKESPKPIENQTDNNNNPSIQQQQINDNNNISSSPTTKNFSSEELTKKLKRR